MQAEYQFKQLKREAKERYMGKEQMLDEITKEC